MHRTPVFPSFMGGPAVSLFGCLGEDELGIGEVGESLDAFVPMVVRLAKVAFVEYLHVVLRTPQLILNQLEVLSQIRIPLQHLLQPLPVQQIQSRCSHRRHSVAGSFVHEKLVMAEE